MNNLNIQDRIVAIMLANDIDVDSALANNIVEDLDADYIVEELNDIELLQLIEAHADYISDLQGWDGYSDDQVRDWRIL